MNFWKYGKQDLLETFALDNLAGLLLICKDDSAGTLQGKLSEISPDADVGEILLQLKDEQALLVKSGTRLGEWGIITRADPLKLLL